MRQARVQGQGGEVLAVIRDPGVGIQGLQPPGFGHHRTPGHLKGIGTQIKLGQFRAPRRIPHHAGTKANAGAEKLANLFRHERRRIARDVHPRIPSAGLGRSKDFDRPGDARLTVGRQRNLCHEIIDKSFALDGQRYRWRTGYFEQRRRQPARSLFRIQINNKLA